MINVTTVVQTTWNVLTPVTVTISTAWNIAAPQNTHIRQLAQERIDFIY